MIEVKGSLFMYFFMGWNIVFFKGVNIINVDKYIINICFVIKKNIKKGGGFKKKIN